MRLKAGSTETSCMPANAFVDTNILLYSISGVPAEARKRDLARAVLMRKDIALSVQVLQEFYVQATQARKRAATHAQAVQIVDGLKIFPVAPITVALMDLAFRIAERYQISYWDAAIVAAAQGLGCHTLLSEDLSDGQIYGGVTVVNPFR